MLYTRTVQYAHSVLDYTQEHFNMHAQFYVIHKNSSVCTLSSRLYTRTVQYAHSVLGYTQEQFNMHAQF